ncbi:MAG: hypothetical protein H0V89_00990, partial [Deltaproteobacteria bacterium]|nr:hypothetical protein [Deltaproteobacteria bacterium]
MSRPDLSFACILAVFAAACAPQSAEIVSGNFTAFMASSTSSSILKDEVDPADFDIYTQLDCRQFCAPSNQSTPESLCVFESKDEETLLHLPDSILSADDCIALMDINSPEEAGSPAPEYPSTFSGDNYAVETWLLQDGYHIVQEELDPWRGEAIINSEGDMQVGFHHRLPGGADFRFDFTINPDFQPTSCRDIVDEAGNPNPDGVTEPVAIDGDWLEEWSGSISDILAEVPADDPRYDLLRKYEDGRLFHINSFAYQFNPDDPQSFENGLWYLPNEWLAGMTFGKFSEEFLSHRSVRYGEPLLYSTFEATDDSQEVV